MNSNLPIRQDDMQKRREADRKLNEQRRLERIQFSKRASINISTLSQDDIEKSIAWLEMQKSSLQSIVDEIDKKIEELRAKLGKPKADSKLKKESKPKNESKQKSEPKLQSIKKEIEPLIAENQGIYKYIGLLLQDKTTGKNIIFAEDEYEGYSPDEHYTEEVMKELIASKKLNYRTRKSQETQKDRTKKKAEVFTPSWICKQMIDMCEPPTDWQELVNSTWLEITCGEAPYIVNRYDATTGISVAIPDRIGILDRKLQAINKNVIQEDYPTEKAYKQAWIDWVYKAYQTTYGYEWQGDNLFIARVNLLQTFFDYFEDKWGYTVSNKNVIENIIDIITFNIWQMDGLSDCLPLTNIPVKIMDWRTNEFIEFRSLKDGGK